jgi:hypothetical protein
MLVRRALFVGLLAAFGCGESSEIAGAGGASSSPSSATSSGTTASSSKASSGAGGASAHASSNAATSSSASGSGAFACSPNFILCEDFEDTAPGAIPNGFQFPQNAQANASNVRVADDQAATGKHSLKIDPSGYQNGIVTNAMAFGSGHWGRLYYRVQVPVPPYFVHTTAAFLHGSGPLNGSEEVRVVGTVQMADGPHQFLYNVQPNGAEFGKGSPYDWKFDGMWHCAEWHIDAPTQSYHYYFDGNEVTSIAIDNGAGNYKDSDIPMSFDELFVGWSQYQMPPDQNTMPQHYSVWIDSVVIDEQRIGCAK